MMKKGNQSVYGRKGTNQLFKYITPGHGSSTRTTSQNTKLHARSMIDLEQGLRGQNIAKGIGENKENHFASISSNHDQGECQSGKSTSLKKFLSMFGGNGNTNSVMNLGSAVKSHREKQQLKVSGKNMPSNNKQIFTCNIKNMNVNVSHSKDKDSKFQNKSPLPFKKEKNQSKMDSGVEMVLKLKKTVQDCKQRQKSLLDQITNFEKENKQLKSLLEESHEQMRQLQQRSSQKQNDLLLKMERLQRQNRKQKCKDHDLIIQSLSKQLFMQKK